MVNAPRVNLSTVEIAEKMTVDNIPLGGPQPKLVTGAKVGRLVRKYFGKNLGDRSGSNGSYRYNFSRDVVDDILKRYSI